MASMDYHIRTDLAVETQERLIQSESEMRGIKYEEKEKAGGITVSIVTIETENASKKTGRPKGKYITIEAPNMTEEEVDAHRQIAKEFSKVLKEIVKKNCKKKEYHVLVVGLGNRDVTPDALGP